MLRFLPFGLSWVLLLGMMALPAAVVAAAKPVSAAASVSPSLAKALEAERIEELCAVDCSGLRATPDRGDGTPFGFGLGLRAKIDGFDLEVTTEGSVFVLGPIRASGDITISAPNIVLLETSVESSGRIEVSNPGFPPIDLPTSPSTLPPGGGILISGDITIVSNPGVPLPDSGGIVIGEGGDLRLRAAQVESTIAAVDGVGELEIALNGLLGLSYDLGTADVYLDLSGVTLATLDLQAGAFILAVGEGAMPVPEASTALFLVIGLAGLAAGRSKTKRTMRETR